MHAKLIKRLKLKVFIVLDDSLWGQLNFRKLTGNIGSGHVENLEIKSHRSHRTADPFVKFFHSW